MANAFEDLRETVESAVAHSADRDARLILVGQISYAVVAGDITPNQGEELEAKLGKREEWKDALEMALFGDVQK